MLPAGLVILAPVEQGLLKERVRSFWEKDPCGSGHAEAEEGTADSKNLALSREKCVEQIALLQKQKAELEEGLSELYRIQAQLAGKPAEKDRRAG